jgi:hypothetical protein
LSEADREALLAMGEDMPKIWHAATTTAADRKQMLRFLIRVLRPGFETPDCAYSGCQG